MDGPEALTSTRRHHHHHRHHRHEKRKLRRAAQVSSVAAGAHRHHLQRRPVPSSSSAAVVSENGSSAFVLPVITVVPPPRESSPDILSISSDDSFSLPKSKSGRDHSRLPPPRSRPPSRQLKSKRSSSWSCGSDCGSDHGGRKVDSDAAGSGKEKRKKDKQHKKLHRRSASNHSLKNVGARTTDESGDNDDDEDDGSEESSSSAHDSGIATTTGGATTSEEGTLANRSHVTPAVSVGQPHGGEFAKDIVSLLIIDGCKECEERLGITEEDYYLGKKENYPLHVYASGQRLKAQCDPNNWMYGRPPGSTTSTAAASSNRRASLLLPEKQSSSGRRLGRPLPPLPPAIHNRPSDTTSVLPRYLQNIIAHHTHISKPQHDAKLLKKLSKSILLPEDPSDPAAFTVTPGLTRRPKPPWCSSKPVLKIAGTFALLMTLLIIAAIVYMNWFSDTFRPMHK